MGTLSGGGRAPTGPHLEAGQKPRASSRQVVGHAGVPRKPRVCGHALALLAHRQDGDLLQHLSLVLLCAQGFNASVGADTRVELLPHRPVQWQGLDQLFASTDELVVPRAPIEGP
eukprot:2633280-Alexandrium_andersonii.AAC.1